MANATELDPVNVENGKRLYEARERKGFTQEELAEKVSILPNSKRPNCNRNTISRYEKGSQPISREYAALFSQVLDVSVEWLLGENEKNIRDFIKFQNNWDNRYLAFEIMAFNSGYTFDLFKTDSEIINVFESFEAIKRGYEIKHNDEIVGNISLDRFNCMVYAIQEQTELYIKQYLREVSDNGNNNPTNQ